MQRAHQRAGAALDLLPIGHADVIPIHVPPGCSADCGGLYSNLWGPAGFAAETVAG
jgi:hypothetical protein